MSNTTIRIQNPSLPILKQIEYVLKEFVKDELTPTPEYLKTGNIIAQKVFDFIKGQKEFKVGRTVIAGSVGKGTALSDSFNPDFDLVFLVNGETPPFKDFIKKIAPTFQAWGENEFPAEFVFGKNNQFSLQFEIGPYKFDLLPAANFEYATSRWRRQLKKTIAAIESFADRSSKHHGGMYSVSLAEFAVEYIGKNTTDFMKSLIRLAKYWNKCVPIDKNVYIPGRSYMIELIAIYANIKKKKRYLFTAFKRFLIAMTHLEDLSIVLKNYYREIPTALENTKLPIILDPVNMYNNIAHRLSDTVIQEFQKKARETLIELQSRNPVYLDELKNCIGTPFKG